MNNFDRQDLASSACDDRTVVSMDEHRAHFCIDADDGVHVVPVALVEDWAAGKKEPHPAVARKIIAEWLHMWLEIERAGEA